MLALTGASGLVGRYLCDELVAYGIPFKYLGRQTNNILDLEAPLGFFYDLSNPIRDDLRVFLEDVDILIHLAALLPNPSSQVIEYFNCNSVATKLLFDLCSDVGVSHFVYMSGANLMEPLDGIVSSDSPYSFSLRHPPYLTSKMAGELLLLSSDSLPCLTIVRPSSIYGFNIKSGLFRNVYDSFVDAMPVTLTQNGLWSSDYIYAGDVAKCLLKIIEKSISGVLTLGSGRVSTTYLVAKSFAHLLDVGDDLIVLEPNVDDSVSLGSLPVVSSAEVISLLGRPPVSVSEGLAHAINKYGTF